MGVWDTEIELGAQVMKERCLQTSDAFRNCVCDSTAINSFQHLAPKGLDSMDNVPQGEGTSSASESVAMNSPSVTDYFTRGPLEFKKHPLNQSSVQQHKSASVVGIELSSSLPNLRDILHPEKNGCIHLKECINRKSLSDIGDPDTLSTENPAVLNSPFADIILGQDAGTQSLDQEECPTCNQNVSANARALSQNISMRPKVGSPTEISITVGPNNNRLSAVLANIPLVYIPHSKQLVSLDGPSLSPAANGSEEATVSDCHQSASPESLSLSKLMFNDNVRAERNMTAASSVKSASLAVLDITDVDSSIGDPPGSSAHNNSSLSQESVVSGTGDPSVIEQPPVDPYSLSLLNLSSDLDEDNATELTHMNAPTGNTAEIALHAVSEGIDAQIKGDAASFSSISSSTGTEVSTSAASCSEGPTETDESGFVEISLGPRNTFERCSRTNSQDSGVEVKQAAPVPGGCGAKPKKKGLSGLLSRGLFSRKPKDTSQSDQLYQPDDGPLGWRLFGKVPPRTCPSKDPAEISEDFRSRQSHPSTSGGLHAKDRVKKTDVEVPSTTALILEQRPAGLPSKTPEEEERHRMEYEAMVEASKRKEQREAKQKKKQLQRQLKYEEELAAALKVWTHDILPSWEVMCNNRRTRELMWSGIPPSVRGKVWKLALGNDLNLTPELYEICANRAQDRLKLMREAAASSDTDSLSSFSNEPASCKESSVDLIRLDVSRTFPQLCIFQKGGPFHELLQGLLGAYACYRPDVGYVQGMSFIAAVLLLNMEVADAFICFANLLNRPCQVAFFRLDESLMKSYFETYEAFFGENLPRLYEDFKRMNISPDLYIIDWMFTLYAKSLPLDVASRVWDVFCRDGEEFLFRTALGILKLHEEVLMSLDFIHLVQFLTRLPENLPGDELFKCIDKIHMTIDNRKFQQVLAGFRDSKET